MKVEKRITKTLAALAFICGLSLTAQAQIGSGWTSTTEGYYIQTSAGCTAVPNSSGGGTFTLPSGKGRAEFRYEDLATTGEEQFQGFLTVNSLGGDKINVKQLFGPAPSTPFVIVAVQKASGGELYEVEGGNVLAPYTIGTRVQVNTIYTPNVSVKVYINGSLAETKTGNGPPNYNKFGAYASASGTGPCTTTWDSIQFWKQGQTGGYYITDVAGVNGTISPTTGFVGPLAAGASTTVTFAPSSGYTSNVYIDNVLTATGTTSYTFTNIQSSHMIYVTFTKGTPPPTFTITATAGTGGTITPAGAITVAAGSNQGFAIAANSGYTISAVTVDGTNQGAISSYTFSNVQANHTIAATFTQSAPPPTFTITATAGTGGTINPSGAISVASGGTQGFAIAANSGYTISAVTVDGTNEGAISSYTFSNVQANHTIAATFTQSAPPPTFTITATAGTGGTINPSGAISVASGGTQGFTIAANSGYTISAVTVDGTNEGAISSYTFSNVQANHTIAATFSQQTGNGPAAPAFSQPGGTYSGEVHVRVTDTTSGVSLYYTTDGSTPTASSTPVPDHTIEFKSTTTLKAIAILNGASSTVTSATYTID